MSTPEVKATVLKNGSLKSGKTVPASGPVGTYTWGGAFCTHQWVDPVKKITGILMTQVRPYFHLNIFRDFVDLVYKAVEE